MHEVDVWNLGRGKETFSLLRPAKLLGLGEKPILGLLHPMAVNTALRLARGHDLPVGTIFAPEPVTTLGVISPYLVHGCDGHQGLFVLPIVLLNNNGAVWHGLSPPGSLQRDSVGVNFQEMTILDADVLAVLRQNQCAKLIKKNATILDSTDQNGRGF